VALVARAEGGPRAALPGPVGARAPLAELDRFSGQRFDANGSASGSRGTPAASGEKGNGSACARAALPPASEEAVGTARSGQGASRPVLCSRSGMVQGTIRRFERFGLGPSASNHEPSTTPGCWRGSELYSKPLAAGSARLN
jgi:hypothetical protein